MGKEALGHCSEAISLQSSKVNGIIEETAAALCEHCNTPIENPDFEDMVCAYQMTEDTQLDARGSITCTCCKVCRQNCHEGRFDDPVEIQEI